MHTPQQSAQYDAAAQLALDSRLRNRIPLDMLSPTTLITGCSRGLGLELVRQMLSIAPEKYTDDSVLIVTCRQPTRADELRLLVESRQSRPRVVLKALDVEHVDQFDDFVKDLQKELGEKGLGLLVNNAGLKTLNDDLESVTADAMMQSFKVNALGPLILTQALLKELKRAVDVLEKSQESALKKPLVLNVSTKMGSIADNTSGGVYPYRASKTAFNMITKSLSVDLGKQGINAVAFHPGWVRTDMGGPKGLIDSEESVAGMLALLRDFKDEFSGGFYDYKGKQLPW